MDSYHGRVDGVPASVTVGPQTLDAGGRMLAYVDMDSVHVAGYAISIGMHPSDGLEVTGLGPRHDAFLTDLDAARSAARRAALLQWTGRPEGGSFGQNPGAPGENLVRVHVFDDGLTVEPRNGTPQIVPFALVDSVERDGYTITLRLRSSDPVTVRRLGPRTDEFVALLDRLRADERQAVAAAYGAIDDRLLGYAAPNGWAVATADAGTFGGALADAFCGGDRAADLAPLIAAAAGLRFGLSLQVDEPMPFLLATGRSTTAVESLGDEARATYVFATTDTDALNRALIMTSFRREAFYLPEDQLGRWSLAARTLDVVRWARSVFRQRIVHDDNWAGAVASALQ